MSDPVLSDLSRLRRRAVRAGGAGALVLALSLPFSPAGALQSWLVAFLLWFGVSLGSLALLMLHNLTGGGWGHAVRRVLEASTRTLPLCALLAVPLFAWPAGLYEWARPDVVAADPLLQHKAPYLNVGFFRLRMVVYFAAWIGLAALCRSLGARNEREGDERSARRLRAVSGPGLAAFGLTLTFASIDWGMSLEPHWFSTMYGVSFIVGQGLSTLCFSIVAGSLLARREPARSHVRTDWFHDLGNLLLAFVMLWAYVAFSQYLIIWTANLAEEVPWYLHRLSHGWQSLAVLLLVAHFGVPFTLLLSRRTKRSRAVLPALAAALFLLRYADLQWLVVPAFEREHALLGLLRDLAALVAVGGLWLAAFAAALRSGPLYSAPAASSAESGAASHA